VKFIGCAVGADEEVSGEEVGGGCEEESDEEGGEGGAESGCGACGL